MPGVNTPEEILNFTLAKAKNDLDSYSFLPHCPLKAKIFPALFLAFLVDANIFINDKIIYIF